MREETSATFEHDAESNTGHQQFGAFARFGRHKSAADAVLVVESNARTVELAARRVQDCTRFVLQEEVSGVPVRGEANVVEFEPVLLTVQVEEGFGGDVAASPRAMGVGRALVTVAFVDEVRPTGLGHGAKKWHRASHPESLLLFLPIGDSGADRVLLNGFRESKQRVSGLESESVFVFVICNVLRERVPVCSVHFYEKM